MLRLANGCRSAGIRWSRRLTGDRNCRLQVGYRRASKRPRGTEHRACLVHPMVEQS